MAETMTPTPAGPRARRPIPTWYYAVGAAGVAVVYFLYRRSQQSAAATSAAAVAPVVPATAASQNNQDLANLLPYLQAAGNVGTNQNSGAFSPPTGEVQQGSGYFTPNSTTPVTGADGHTYSWIATPQQLNSVLASGGTSYYQPVPGVFQSLSTPGAANSLSPGTPQYLQVQ
jgi:hypothetical protein